MNYAILRNCDKSGEGKKIVNGMISDFMESPSVQINKINFMVLRFQLHATLNNLFSHKAH